MLGTSRAHSGAALLCAVLDPDVELEDAVDALLDDVGYEGRNWALAVATAARFAIGPHAKDAQYRLRRILPELARREADGDAG